MSARTWIGLDPSISAFGYAVLRRLNPAHFNCVDVGTWRTRIESADKKTADRSRRINEITSQFTALLAEHDPESVWCEAPILGPATSRLTAQVLGRVFGNIEGICKVRGIQFMEIQPATLKQVVCGRKRASKEEVARAVRRYYANHPGGALLDGSLDDNATDALAAAHVGAYRDGAGVTVSSGVVSYRESSDGDGDFFYD